MNNERPLYLLYIVIAIQALLIIGKLLGISDLNWVYTFLPIIIPLAGFIICLALGVIIIAIFSIDSELKTKK